MTHFMGPGRRAFALSVALVGFVAYGCDSTDAAGGDGGAAGADGGAIAGDAGATTVKQLTRAQVAEGCVRTAACGIRYQGRVANCVDAYFNLRVPLQVWPAYASILNCVRAAKGDCKKIFACHGSKHEGASCTAKTKGTCDGAKATACDLLEKRLYTLDCAKAGMKCVIPTNGSFDARCAPDACKPGYTANCKGDLAYTCSSGVVEVEDCKLKGLGCSKNYQGLWGCRGTRDRCGGKDLPIFSPWCATTKGEEFAVTCVGNKEKWEVCAKRRIPHKCIKGVCALEAKGCDDAFNTCDGDKLRACLDGKWQTFDCKQMGFSGCGKQSVGASCTYVWTKPAP